ncbi:hypothetical protein E2P76_05845 [Lactiplantibacillus plantarum]|nr:hypothetical protein E2P76_05845 [Lactiplantibacillus plantarum]
MTTDYRDDTALTDTEKSTIDGLATAIRTKTYGKDVREAMATGLELAGTGASTTLTPNGVITNVSELNTQYPQGTSGIFVTSDTGHWYYWNGTAWTDGGDYQSALLDLIGKYNWLDNLNLLTDDYSNSNDNILPSSSNSDSVVLFFHGPTINDIKGETVSGGITIKNCNYDARIQFWSDATGVVYGNTVSAKTVGKSTFTVKVPDSVTDFNVCLSINTPTTDIIGYQSDAYFVKGTGSTVISRNDSASILSSADLTIREKLLALMDASGVIAPGFNLLNDANSSSDYIPLVGHPVPNGDGKTNIYFKGPGVEKLRGKMLTFSMYVKNCNYPVYLSAWDDVNGATPGVSIAANSEGYITLTFEINENATSYFVVLNTDETTLSTTNISGQFKEADLNIGSEKIPFVDSLYNLTPDNLLTFLINNFSDTVKPLSQAINYQIPQIYISGQYPSMLYDNQSAVLPFKIYDKNRQMSGYVKTEWQGDSSKKWAKKGFKFKTYSDSAATIKLNWQPSPYHYKSNNFNLKAYLTDKWNINDAICAEIYAQMIASNTTAPEHLHNSSHYGTIVSKPYFLYFEGAFYGLMEMNTKSDDNLVNTDSSNDDHILIEGQIQSDGSRWRSTTPTLADNTGDFNFVAGKSTNAQTALTALADKIANKTGNDFKSAIQSANMNITSICDYIIFNYIVNNMDAWDGKNIMYLTYDGGSSWFMIGYDFDGTLGNSATPGSTMDSNYDYFSGNNDGNLILEQSRTVFATEMLARFNELVSNGVLTNSNLIQIVNDKINLIPQGAFEAEWNRWSGFDSGTYSEAQTVHDIIHMLIHRKSLLQSKLNAMQKNVG